MRHTIYIPVLATLFLLAASVSNAQPLKAKKPAPSKPAPKKLDPRMEKLMAIGERLGGALEIALDLFSGNEAALLSGNRANLLSGNTPKVLSENQTPIFSGNRISLFSNFKVEIHIENSGNRAGAPPAVKPVGAPAVVNPSAQIYEPTRIYTPSPAPTFGPTLGPTLTPAPATTTVKPQTKEVEQPSGTIYFPPASSGKSE
jgi:hypothetical protein